MFEFRMNTTIPFAALSKKDVAGVGGKNASFLNEKTGAEMLDADWKCKAEAGPTTVQQ